MGTYAKVCGANRHKMRSLLVLAALYVVIGLGLAVVSAINGEPLGAFLGFLIVSCTIGGTALLRAVWRLNAQAAALSDRLAAIAAATHRLEQHAAEQETSPLETSDEVVRTLDLAALGGGDPSRLAAAVLDRATYPRLAKAIEDHPEALAQPGAASAPKMNVVEPPEAARSAGVHPDAEPAGVSGALPSPPAGHSGNGEHTAPTGENGRREAPASIEPEAPGPMSNVMMRRWKTAYREGDLPACREVFSAFEPIADADLVRSMRDQLDEVIQRTERRLRLQFQQLVHEQQFDQALRVGDDIERLLPGRPMAQEFMRIRPYLERRSQKPEATTSVVG